MSRSRSITMLVNGEQRHVDVEPRKLLSDVLRQDLGLTGTHVGCEHGVCGACTVLVDGQPIRSCLAFAVQVADAEVTTVESLATSEEDMHPLQEAFWEHHGLQCGFCTAGFLMSSKELLERNPDASDDDIRAGLAGNICRCTGYVNIIKSVVAAAKVMREDGS